MDAGSILGASGVEVHESLTAEVSRGVGRFPASRRGRRTLRRGMPMGEKKSAHPAKQMRGGGKRCQADVILLSLTPRPLKRLHKTLPE